MSRHDAILEEICASSRESVLQKEPYPVVAPGSVAGVTDAVRIAVKHGYTIMPIGSGSSFAADFAVGRPETMAIMSVRLFGVEAISGFALRVLAGTPLSAVFRGAALPQRRTVGGFVCGSRGLAEDAYLRWLWPCVRCVEMVTAVGETVRFCAETVADATHPPLASMLIGSRGRLGIVTAIEMFPPLPIVIRTERLEQQEDIGESRGLSVLEFNDLRSAFDKQGAFHW
jgi:FAD/FMN-containing dehydrogenase